MGTLLAGSGVDISSQAEAVGVNSEAVLIREELAILLDPLRNRTVEAWDAEVRVGRGRTVSKHVLKPRWRRGVWHAEC